MIDEASKEFYLKTASDLAVEGYGYPTLMGENIFSLKEAGLTREEVMSELMSLTLTQSKHRRKEFTTLDLDTSTWGIVDDPAAWLYAEKDKEKTAAILRGTDVLTVIIFDGDVFAGYMFRRECAYENVYKMFSSLIEGYQYIRTLNVSRAEKYPDHPNVFIVKDMREYIQHVVWGICNYRDEKRTFGKLQNYEFPLLLIEHHDDDCDFTVLPYANLVVNEGEK